MRKLLFIPSVGRGQQNHCLPRIIEGIQYLDAINYPRNEQGELQGMIHPQLQFQDYQPLNPGDLMFLTFKGDAIAYSGNATVYPIFVNEAAYYEKGIAMYFTERVLVKI